MTAMIVGTFGDATDPAVLADATRALRDCITTHGRPRSVSIGVLGEPDDVERRPVLDWEFPHVLYRQTFRERPDWRDVTHRLVGGLTEQLAAAGVDANLTDRRRGRRGRCRAR